MLDLDIVLKLLDSSVDNAIIEFIKSKTCFSLVFYQRHFPKS